MQFWDIMVEGEGHESDRIRGLTEAQKITLMEIFRREDIRATAIEYDAEHDSTGHEESVK